MPSKARPKKAGKTSRDLAIVAIVVLVVVAVAGLLQATREHAAPASSTSQAASPMTASASVPATAASPATPARVAGPNDVLFDDNSDRLPADANTKLAVIADTARAEHKALTLSMQIENMPGAMDLAKRRADAVKHALVANGVAAGTIKSQIMQTSPGLGSPQRVDRVIVVLR